MCEIVASFSIGMVAPSPFSHRRAPVSTKSTFRPPQREHTKFAAQSGIEVSAP
jgi:hypothetical protein